MKRNKILLTALLLLILTALVACTSGKKTTDPVHSPDSEPAPTETATATPSADSSSSEENSPTPSGSSDLPPEEHVITVKEAIDIANALPEGETAAERYYIRAKVSEITNANYGAMNIADESGTIYVYGSYSADGTVGYASMTDKPYKDAEIYISALVQNFRGTPELKSVWILEFKNADINVDESKYTDMSVLEARNAEEGKLIKVDGVVAQMTYANGKIPSGFILVDNTNAIYVYDGQIAARVAIGNTVTVLAEKTNWILESEQANAEKFGYDGCCQLQNAVLKSNDGKTADFDTSWISETTVKDIMETPVTENITTTIYKVNAFVQRSAGNGFVNYYINDLDGKTGSYTYTQCSGGDFEWLDAFDGKVCTVYLTVLNAKSTGTGCVWRFLPVKVVDENFTFDMSDAAEFAVNYYVLDQFLPSYAADPVLNLTTSVTVDTFDFTVDIGYTSDNTKVAYIENGVLHIAGTGKATITVTAKCGNYKEYTTTVEILSEVPTNYDYITVKDAIDAGVNDSVTVKGVVASSLVNQKGGFYLIDATGVIAVKFNLADDIKNIAPGDEIIITGKRDAYKAQNGYPGQVCITGATLVVNLYGEKDYSTATFVTDKSFADIYALAEDTATDYTTTVFVTDVKIDSKVTTYAANFYLVNPDNSEERITLYSASGAQYLWLGDYVGKTVKMEFALCNWNAKNPYKACVLAVYTESGEKIVNTLNFD